MNARDAVLLPMTRSARLRAMLLSDETEFLMEAHNGLSARIVREAGFKGIWASGLAISAQFGVRDNNEASWTQVVDDLEFMADASDLPILLDGDTGYGNFNNVRRLVRKLEQRGIAGVCIEDKVFPKTNSFIGGERQPLADVDEFCGKIKAGKDAQHDEHFSIVARVEALIAGWGMDEALRRAEAYRAAGADAILIHSKLSKPDEILDVRTRMGEPRAARHRADEVLQHADRRVPQGRHQRRDLGEPPDPRGDRVDAGGREGDPRHRDARQRRGPHRAGQRDLPPAGRRRIHGRPRSATCRRRARPARPSCSPRAAAGASRPSRPTGRRSCCRSPASRCCAGSSTRSRRTASTTSPSSAAIAPTRSRVDRRGRHQARRQRALRGDRTSWRRSRPRSTRCTATSSISYGDLLFRSYILRDLVDSDAPFTVVVDSSLTGPPRGAGPNTTVRDYAYCSAPDDRDLFGRTVRLERISNDVGARRSRRRTAAGSACCRARGDGPAKLRALLTALRSRDDFDTLDMPALLNALIDAGEAIEVRYVHGHWRGVNDLEDFRLAGDFAHAQAPLGVGRRRRSAR